MQQILIEDSANLLRLCTTVVRQKGAALCECKICGASARYSYYGAIVCPPCKIFFRRNGPNEQKINKCDYGGQCDININNRHVCSACRLAKCFAHGMRTDMIRACSSRINRIDRKVKLIDHSRNTSLKRWTEKQQSEQLQTSRHLQSDQSTLTIDQWNLLSNLVHSYDEHCGYSFVERFIHDQNTLPVKLRFKYASLTQFFPTMMTQIQLVFEKNRDYLSLSLHDRTMLLRSTAEYTVTVGSMFLMRRSRLFDHPAFYTSAELLFRPNTVSFSKQVIDSFDVDETFMKLILAILSFSTTNYTVYEQSMSLNLVNLNVILPTQHMYTELAWRYLVHKYNEHEAVRRFTNIVRCLLLATNTIAEAHESKQFLSIVDFVIEQCERRLI